MNVKDFILAGAYDTVGFGLDRSSSSNKYYTGWGHNWKRNGALLERLPGSTSKLGVAGSIGRVTIFGPLMTVGPNIVEGWKSLFKGDATGYSKAAIGAASWGVAELLSSSIMTTSSAPIASGIGSAIGATIGGPVGYVGGAAIGSFGMPALAATAAVGLAGLAGVTAAYTGARGSYEVLKAGYNHRQRMLSKIDTAGSTAAFMTRNAYTMRSMAVETIRNSHMNARSALGSEAQYLHFSAYKKFSNNRVY